MSKDIEYIDCKWVSHYPAKGKRPDMHMVKEQIHYKDGTVKPNIRFIKDYKRPFWVTNEIYRNHKDKKEFEDISKCTKHMSDESNLPNNIARHTGMNGYNKNKFYDIKNSPYLYGADIKSSTFIKKWYMDKWSGKATTYSYCAFDIEADIDTSVISVITAIFGNKVRTYINRSLVGNRDDVINRVKEKLRVESKRVKEELLEGLTGKEREDKAKYLMTIEDWDIELFIEEDNVEVIKACFKQIHAWQPDVLSAWGARYDMSTITGNLEKAHINPVDVLADPSIPAELRHYKFVEGQVIQITESGVRKNKDFHEQWHKYELTASFIVLDAMAVYNYIRVNTAKVPGGYGVDNICKVNGVGGKLNLSKTELPGGSIAWHKYMTRVEPLNYIAYNIWDVVIMKLLDKKTKDIELNLGLLAGVSSFDIFNSGPKRIVDDFFFYGLDNNVVIGTSPQKQTGGDCLTLKNWIVTLSNFRTMDMGYKCIKGDSELTTNFRLETTDVDQTSGYPSDTVASNLGQATTVAEVLSIGDIEKETLKDNNMNALYGNCNDVRYGSEMVGLPTMTDIYLDIEKKIA